MWQGCDASVLLDATPFSESEKDAEPNASLTGFTVIDEIKSALEHDCPATVSCADVIALASRDAVALLGGPTWNVPLGRKDSRFAADKESTTNSLPSPNDNLGALVAMFGALYSRITVPHNTLLLSYSSGGYGPLKRAIADGDPVRFEDVENDETTTAYKLRKWMEGLA